jgi:hypothetical protein
MFDIERDHVIGQTFMWPFGRMRLQMSLKKILLARAIVTERENKANVERDDDTSQVTNERYQ